ncbi:MAG: beta-ketoacyl-[acyl-carrier-protein] synthase family protein [Paludibacteraceae bacterium]|nr:beta-ketoacyl-[acyl-carrier-protein] synthase family protein [Paludibacteraceae bacterium]
MKIAITGIGTVSAIGINSAETLESLLAERSGIGEMRILGSRHADLPVGEVAYSNEQLKAMAGVSAGEAMPRTSLLGLIAAREAITMSHGVCDAFINGTTVGGMDLTEQHWTDYAQGKATENIRLHEAGESTKVIARYLEQPFQFIATPSTACSSALNAIMLGANMLRTGQAKRVLAGGAESLSKFHLNGFNTLMILDHEPCRPFDANRHGLNLGEGAGYLVIESEEEAKARGAHILGYISGYANTCDAFHQTASSEDGEGAYLAMEGALQMAGLNASEIDYVNAHGTATPNNDMSESAALRRVFGEKMPSVSSTKAFTGHTTSASGGLEAAICVLAMQKSFVPANLHWTQTAEGLIVPSARTEHKQLRHILCNAFGFGGNESSLIISAEGSELSMAERLLAKRAYVIEQTDDADIQSYVSAGESRRMTLQTRRMVAAARRAMSESGVEHPDAIVCATQWGCMLQSMRYLQDMLESDEEQLKPTPFIQSTHNTIASQIAILTNNHHYNSTYSQGKQSVSCAIADIEMQMSLGLINNALVLEFDELVEAWDAVLSLIGDRTQAIAKATVYIKNN